VTVKRVHRAKRRAQNGQIPTCPVLHMIWQKQENA